MSTTPEFLPSLGMSGFYNLKSPYSSLISPAKQYTCVGVMSLSGALASGIDPLQTVYLASGDTEANYKTDLENNIFLITIRSGEGSLVVFPSNALIGVPTGEGVIYRNTVLGVALAAIPDGIDLTLLQKDISDLTFHRLGVKSATFLSAVGAPTILTSEQHETVSTARQAIVQNTESTIYKNLVLTRQNEALIEQVRVLENYIKTNLPPTP